MRRRHLRYSASKIAICSCGLVDRERDENEAQCQGKIGRGRSGRDVGAPALRILCRHPLFRGDGRLFDQEFLREVNSVCSFETNSLWLVAVAAVSNPSDYARDCAAKSQAQPKPDQLLAGGRSLVRWAFKKERL